MIFWLLSFDKLAKQISWSDDHHSSKMYKTERESLQKIQYCLKQSMFFISYNKNKIVSLHHII